MLASNLSNMPSQRFEKGLAQYEKALAAKPEAEERLTETVKADWMTLCSFQTLQSRAHAAGRLSLSEAQWLYQRLGGENPTPEKWDALPLLERLFITAVMGELASGGHS